jgi:hypothetical protein
MDVCYDMDESTDTYVCTNNTYLTPVSDIAVHIPTIGSYSGLFRLELPILTLKFLRQGATRRSVLPQ